MSVMARRRSFLKLNTLVRFFVKRVRPIPIDVLVVFPYLKLLKLKLWIRSFALLDLLQNRFQNVLVCFKLDEVVFNLF